MYLREWFGFPPPLVRAQTGYDPKQDVVFLKLGRQGVRLSPEELGVLVEDLGLAFEEQAEARGVVG